MLGESVLIQFTNFRRALFSLRNSINFDAIMFSMLIVVFLYLRSYIFPPLQELRSVSYRRALLFLHPKVNNFSLTHKKKVKDFLKIFPSWGIFPTKGEVSVQGAVTSFYIRNTECGLIQSKDYLGLHRNPWGTRKNYPKLYNYLGVVWDSVNSCFRSWRDF